MWKTPNKTIEEDFEITSPAVWFLKASHCEC
jgi:hypothetical protein